MIPRLSMAQIAMLVVCVLMAGLFAYQLMAPPAQFALPDVHLKPKTIAMQTPAPFIAPPQAAFDAINARPLFLPSRKAIAALDTGTGATQAGPPPLPNMAVIGVIGDAQNSIAMVKLAGSPFAQAMGVGAALGGWQIATIGPDKIVLRAGPFTQEVKIDARAGNPPPPPQPPGNATPQKTRNTERVLRYNGMIWKKNSLGCGRSGA
jgi:hypothetical protein